VDQEQGHEAPALGYPARSLGEILDLIDSSDLSSGTHSLARAIFTRLGEAEAVVHNQPLEEVHLHEVGAVDALVDIVGAAIGLELLGVSYGRSLASTIAALTPRRKVAMTVVPIIGALGTDNPKIDGPELVRQIAHLYGGEFRYLPVPLIVEDVRTRDALVQSPHIYETLHLARKSNIALLGIGSPLPQVASSIWNGYLNERELSWLKDQGAVGHMCGQFFDIQGQLLDIDINQCAISIGIKALANIEVVVAVAGGEAKAEAILGALRGQYLNILVTDDAAASRVLALAEMD
jgi:deoxyribonucleoside regulator